VAQVIIAFQARSPEFKPQSYQTHKQTKNDYGLGLHKCETLFEKQLKQKGLGGMAQVIEPL
jgi:hypothetical protein